jgi:hypothetical protein
MSEFACGETREMAVVGSVWSTGMGKRQRMGPTRQEAYDREW